MSQARALPRTEQESASSRWRAGLAFAATGNPAQARAIFLEFIGQDPNHEQAWFQLAQASDSPQQAAACLQKVLDINPQNLLAREQLGEKRFQAGLDELAAGRSEAARQIFRHLVRQNPQHEQAWVHVARLAESERDARFAWKRTLKINPNNEEALDAIRHSEDSGPSQPWYCPLCGHGALEALTQCGGCGAVLDLELGDVLIFNPKLHVRQIEKAIDHYRKLLAVENDSGTHQTLSLAYANLKRWREAQRHADLAAQLRPLDRELAAQHKKLVQISKLVQAAAQRANHPLSTLKHLLIVDPSPVLRKLVAITLDKQGFRVSEADGDLQAGQAMIQAGVPDIILIDSATAGLGLDLCKKFRKTPATAHVPIVFLSSEVSWIDSFRGRIAGSSAWLAKPFHPDQLIETVRQHVR